MTGDAETWRCDARWATVWPTGRHSITTSRTYGPTADAPRGGPAVSAAVAAHAIAVYSQPGDTVCDPDCGPGTVVTEAVHAHRHAIGITNDPDQWEAARSALTLAKTRGARGDGMVLDRLPDSESWTGLGPVDLVLTAIGPPGPAEPTGPVEDRLHPQLAAYRELPRPGGHLVVLATHHLSGGTDLASQIATAGRDTGWRPVQRAVALTAVPYTRELGTHRPTGPARAHPVHQDVIIFRAEGGRARHPHPPLPPAPHTVLSASHRPAA
ncbi:class I SAM-dependent methyltransferase [Pseudofrankia asymbiotica]|uniref:SAM-dependent methyltransferase n=1 Tax=Pseudofrankia asymbiotica TaxID=1834516 RepID=A0A1V2I4G4_9ACTN|nr:class I SAM-dependent methyltransferase [Pseudofrankia asymbiotica]ONH25252.1 SAM-dependent methyltransferase [Pseudofrankia asymbiotica]